jgi:hypothetical protein
MKTFGEQEPHSSSSAREPIAGYAGRGLLPRLIRLRDAPYFFGMDKNRFNREVRPLLTEIRVGKQGCAFDRLEMEAAAEDYKSRNGRPAAERNKPWDNSRRPVSSNAVGSGTSTRSSEEREFARALARVNCDEPKSSLHSGSTTSAKPAFSDCEPITRSGLPRQNS